MALTTQQVAEALKCDLKQVRQNIRLGLLRAQREPNGRYTVTEEELQRFKEYVSRSFY